VPERLGLLVDEMRLAQIELGLSRPSPGAQ